MISRNQDHLDTGSMALLKSRRHFGAQRVLNTEKSGKDQLLFILLLCIRFVGIIDLPIGNGNNPKPPGSQLRHLFLRYVAFLLAGGYQLPCRRSDLSQHWPQNFPGTLGCKMCLAIDSGDTGGTFLFHVKGKIFSALRFNQRDITALFLQTVCNGDIQRVTTVAIVSRVDL